MDAKKLQQLQEAAILAQQQKKLPLAYQTNLVDYRTAAYSQALFSLCFALGRFPTKFMMFSIRIEYAKHKQI